MSKRHKHRKAEVSENPLSAKTGPSASEDRLLDNNKEPPTAVRKEVSAIWPLLVFVALFLLALLVGWLTK